MPCRRPLERALAALALLAALLWIAPAAQAEVHKDARIGYQIQVPKGWTETPLQTSEQWIVAKFVSDKREFWTDPGTGYTSEFQPELRVIAFIDELINRSDFGDIEYESEDDEEEDEPAGEGEDEEEKRLRGLRLLSKYKDYPAYLKGTLSEGFYIEEDEVKSIRGEDVQCLGVKLEQRGRYITSRVFDTEIGKVVVEFDFFEHQLKKENSTIQRTFNSFKTIERTVALDLDKVGTFISLADIMSKSPEERAEFRRDEQDEHWERMTSDLLDGWEAKEISGVRILTCVDDRYNKRLVDRIRAVYAWLDKTFPDVGPEEYVRYPLLRVCNDRDEMAKLMNIRSKAYVRNIYTRSTELITFKDTGVGIGSQNQRINQEALRRWLQERAPNLRFSLPDWLDVGMSFALSSATVKGTKLRHGPDDFERKFIRDAVREETTLSVRSLMMMTSKELERALENREFQVLAQSAALARFLTDGAGSKGKYKNVMQDYVANLSDVLDEIQAEEDAERELKRQARKEAEEAGEEWVDDDEPKTEEEEDAMIKERQERRAEKEEMILRESFERTFKGWSDKEWDAFEKAYAKALK